MLSTGDKFCLLNILHLFIVATKELKSFGIFDTCKFSVQKMEIAYM